MTPRIIAHPTWSCLGLLAHRNEVLLNFLQVHVFPIPVRVFHMEQYNVLRVGRASHHLSDERAVPATEGLANEAPHQRRPYHRPRLYASHLGALPLLLAHGLAAGAYEGGG